MGAGRPAKPTALKVLQGNPGRRPKNAREPKAQRGRPKCPAWLSAKARAAWGELCDLLDSMRVLTISDRKALELLCDAYAEWRDARETIRKEGGPTYRAETESGFIIRARPEVAIAADAWRRVKALLSEFGLTPSARTKVQALDDGNQDPFDAFLDSNREA